MYSFENVDSEWLIQHALYDRIREQLLTEYSSLNVSFREKLGFLTILVDQYLRKDDLNTVWAAYNILREFLGLSVASSPQNIDRTWFHKMKREAITSLLIEIKGLELPTKTQKQLIEQVSRSLNLEKEVIALSDPESIGGIIGGQSGFAGTHYYYIAPCKTPDLDFLSYIVNHEFAHIVYGDHETQLLLNTNQIQFANLIKQQEFEADLESVERYFNLGLKALPSLKNTSLGKNLAALLAQPESLKALKDYQTLWIPPQNPEEKEKMIYLRGKEQRADLFALKQLFRSDDLNPIFKVIQVYVSLENRPEPYIVAEGTREPHPSDIERATLYDWLPYRSRYQCCTETSKVGSYSNVCSN